MKSLTLDESLKIKDIFKTAGTPTVTYVKRANGKFEKDLEEHLRIPGKICLITGPSKTGKSTLFSTVISGMKLDPLVVDCGRDMSVEDIWRKALERVNFRQISEKTKNGELAVSTDVKVGIKGGWAWLAKMMGEFGIGLSVTGRESSGEIQRSVLARPGPQHMEVVLKTLPYVLVIEDFHYLKEDVKASLFHQIKHFVNNEISIVVVGTTHHIIDLAIANKDLSGRVFHQQTGSWGTNDLKQIVHAGFQAIGKHIGTKLIELVASESVGLPMITQAICYRLFSEKGIENVGQLESIRNISFSRQDVLGAMGKVGIYDYGMYEPIYTVLVDGYRKGARKYDSYNWLLLAFTTNPVSFSLKRDQIYARLEFFRQQYSNINVPTTASINHALATLRKLQLKKGKGFEVFEWSEKQDTLYVVDFAFLFFLRCKFRDNNSGVIDVKKEDMPYLFKIFKIDNDESL